MNAEAGRTTTFGLVHGAYHGSWCWQLLIPELECRGHQVLTVDLPCEDPDAGGIEYAASAVEAFAAADDLTLVGHSLGGLTIPLIATLRPVRRMVFLSAMVPRPGRAHGDVEQEEPDIYTGAAPEGGAYTDASGATRWHPQAAASFFYSDCPPETAAWAAKQLRGQFWKISNEVTPLTAWPDVPVTAVIGTRDPVLNPIWSRRVSTAVLGVDPIELDCGHAAFISTPKSLAEILVSSDRDGR
jgi:pimeloyl-ACP methyl ester carboxylesterase